MPRNSRHFVLFGIVAFGVLLPLAKAATGHTYQAAKYGACRGPGGANDKIESKFVKEKTLEACKADCDAETNCKGLTYHPTANGGECNVYGPGMAGSCSVASATSPAACAALGTCEETSKTTEITCGKCSEASAPSDATCASVGGKWTALKWTSSGAVWSDADDPWTGEWQSSHIIAGVAPSAGYKCYDIDPEDHEAKCTGSDQCIAHFAGKAAAQQIVANCASPCKFTAAVAATKVVVPHAPAIAMAGYTVKSGACRGPNVAKVNGKYSNTAGASGAQLTQQECAAECNTETMCVGYAHSTAWCVVYGPGINNTKQEKWTSDTHDATTITGTKPNAAYICAVKGTGAIVATDTSMADITASYSQNSIAFAPLVIIAAMVVSTAAMRT
jgi:hypothetical protein